MTTPEPTALFELANLTAASLESIREYVRAALTRLGCVEACDGLVLAVDEVCANLAEHAPTATSNGSVRIYVRREGFDAIIVVEDHGVPFHPADAPMPDLSTDWESRRVGGLGWFLVRQMVDGLTYEAATIERSDALPRTSDAAACNRLTLVKRDACLAPPPVSE